MPKRNIVVVGASAGGLEPSSVIFSALTPGIDAVVFFVMHVMPHAPSRLPRILARYTRVPVVHPMDGAPLSSFAGRIVVAPPDRHLVLEGDRVHLSRGPHENSSRPAVDPLFTSAANAYGPRVIGLVLSGALDDGAVGITAVKRRGGIAVVQDPETALYKGMPASALAAVDADHVLAPSAIGPLLVQLVEEDVSEKISMRKRKATDDTEAGPETYARPDEASGFTCPSCHGALWANDEGKVSAFRCRTGHRFSAQSLYDEQSSDTEAALRAGYRALREKAALARRISERATASGQRNLASLFEARSQTADLEADRLGELLERVDSSAAASAAEEEES